MANNAFHGAQYLSKGFRLIRLRGIRTYVLIPLCINLVLLSLATVYAFAEIDNAMASMKSSEYAWIQWAVENLQWLLWPIITIVVLIVVFFIFAFIANWIAAPFNGLLAEAVESHLAGEAFESTQFSWSSFIADIPRLFAREFRKLAYYVPRALGCALLFLLTFWNPLFFIAPIVWFGFNAWMAAVQYIDYPMDNHKVGFNQVLAEVKSKRSGSLGFGSIVMLLTMIPVVNILVMPAAVAGATNLWFDHFRTPNLS